MSQMGVQAGGLFASTSNTPELIRDTFIVTHILPLKQNF
jgi:hypothetical protein